MHVYIRPTPSPFYSFLLFKKTKLKPTFFFFFQDFSLEHVLFLSTHLCLRSSDKKGEKNCVSYGCSLHPEFYVSSKKIHKKSHKIIISDVSLQAALNSREEGVQ